MTAHPHNAWRLSWRAPAGATQNPQPASEACQWRAIEMRGMYASAGIRLTAQPEPASKDSNALPPQQRPLCLPMECMPQLASACGRGPKPA